MTEFGGKQWYEDEAGFAAELARGRRSELRVAMMLLPLGLWLRMGAMQQRHGIASHDPELADQADLEVEKGHCIEVKGRNITFTGPQDFPFETAIVCTVARWNRRERKPCAMVLLSEATGGILVIPASTHPLWLVKEQFDPRRGFTDMVYAAPRSTWKTLQSLTNHLTQRDCTKEP